MFARARGLCTCGPPTLLNPQFKESARERVKVEKSAKFGENMTVVVRTLNVRLAMQVHRYLPVIIDYIRMQTIAWIMGRIDCTNPFQIIERLY